MLKSERERLIERLLPHIVVDARTSAREQAELVADDVLHARLYHPSLEVVRRMQRDLLRDLDPRRTDRS